MKVIICGAGLVGMSIAEYLAKDGGDVTIVDVSEKATEYMQDNYDIRTIDGYASDPKILEIAGADDADMLIAVTNNDEVNITACLIASEVFNIPTRIVRIRNENYLQHASKAFLQNKAFADLVISPEYEVAHSLARSLRYPGAIDILPIFNGEVAVVSAICPEKCPIVETPLRELTLLFPELNMRILAVIRNDQLTFLKSTDVLKVGDKIYFSILYNAIERGLRTLGFIASLPENILIIGGGDVGQHLYSAFHKLLEDEAAKVNITIIEKDEKMAHQLAEKIENATVIYGDGLDIGLLRDIGIDKMDSLCCVTNHDETNIFAAIAAKKLGVKNTLTIINSNSYHQMVETLGIDVILHPREITTSSILRYIRYGDIHQAFALAGLQCELLHIRISDTSPIIDKNIMQVKLPKDSHIGMIRRNNDIINVTSDTILKKNDEVLVFTASYNARKIEKLFIAHGGHF